MADRGSDLNGTVDDFVARLQQLADEGRDPTEDDETCAFLLAHPELLEAFATWRESCVLLAATPHPRPPTGATSAGQPRSKARRQLLAASLAVLVVTTGWWVLSDSPGDPIRSGRSEVPRSLPAGTGRVLAASFATAHSIGSLTWREEMVFAGGQPGHHMEFTSTVESEVQGTVTRSRFPATFTTREVLR